METKDIFITGGVASFWGKDIISASSEKSSLPNTAEPMTFPTFGLCLGIQTMVIEFAREVLGYQDANSMEFAPSAHPVIDMMEEQKSITQIGGTMRLGAYDCELKESCRACEAYGGVRQIRERHRHRYEFNYHYQDAFEVQGMKCVGINPAAKLVEIVKIPTKRWYVGTQFHLEYSSTVLHPHPLFMSFIKACIDGRTKA